MNEKKPDNETVVRQDAPGEDWLNGRGAFCGRCGGKDNKPTVAWDASEGCVRCSECVYINPDATREVVLYLLEQRAADGDVIKADQQKLDKVASALGYEGMGDDDELLPFAKGVIARADKLEDDLEKAHEEIANARESEKEAEDVARAKIEKLEADLKEARAKSKTAKVEGKKE